jgi:Abortive infection C-terminus
MSSLTIREQAKLERLFEMESGYILNFSNSSLRTFMLNIANIDIHDTRYCSITEGKANKMREFWRIESDQLVGNTINALIDKAETNLTYHKNDNNMVDLIKECRRIADRLLSGQINLGSLKQAVQNFDYHYIVEQIKRMELSVHNDPALAIGTAKELIETCCKTILAERGISINGTPDIPTLTKTTLKELNLVPENISEKTRGSDVIKRLLQNLGTIGNGLAELRGLYGTGHGKDGKTNGLSARHAKLAVGAAATFATFLFDTHEETKNKKLLEDVA